MTIARAFRLLLSMIAIVIVAWSFIDVARRINERRKSEAQRPITLTILHWGGKDEDQIVDSLKDRYTAEHPNVQADLNFLRGLLERFPKVQPNAPAICDLCYVEQRNSSFPDQDYSGRIDYNISDRDSANVRYQYSRQHRWPAQIIVGEAANQNHKQQNVSFTETHIFNSSTSGEFRFVEFVVENPLLTEAIGNDAGDLLDEPPFLAREGKGDAKTFCLGTS